MTYRRLGHLSWGWFEKSNRWKTKIMNQIDAQISYLISIVIKHWGNGLIKQNSEILKALVFVFSFRSYTGSHYLDSSFISWRHRYGGGCRTRSKCQLVIGQDTCSFLLKPINSCDFSESYWLKKRQSIARILREGWGRFFPLSKLTHRALKTDKNGLMFTYYE